MNDERHRPASDDDRLDAIAREASADYNEPPRELDEMRRERLWQRIQEARAGEAESAPASSSSSRTPAPRPARRRQALRWIAAAAVLVIGIGIGRLLPTGSEPTVPTTVANDPGAEENPRWSQDTAEALYRLAARDYLMRTETLLTEFRQAAAHPGADVSPNPSVGGGTVGWAGDLLLEARLLLDSPAAANDVRLSRLLRDLELILAEIVQMADDAPAREGEMIRESIEDQSLMLRLREEMPAEKGLPRA